MHTEAAAFFCRVEDCEVTGEIQGVHRHKNVQNSQIHISHISYIASLVKYPDNRILISVLVTYLHLLSLLGPYLNLLAGNQKSCDKKTTNCSKVFKAFDSLAGTL